MYSDKLDHEVNINPTRLKEKLMMTFPDLTSHMEGKNVMLMFKKYVGAAGRIALFG